MLTIFEPSLRILAQFSESHDVAEVGLTAVVELVGILGYYSLVSMTINAFEVPPPDGAPQPFVS